MNETQTPATETPAEQQTSLPTTEERYVAPKRRRRWGDRKDGRRLRTIQPMSRLMPFIMPKRSDGCNQFADAFDVTEADRYCRRMIRDGYTNFNFMHLLIAAYVRAVSQYPAINRYISGLRVYARTNITVVMTIKKSMRLDSPDTCIKVKLDPRDNVYNVYKKFQKTVKEALDSDSDFDKVAGVLTKMPRPILRGIVSLLKWLDYHGWLPKALMNVSPFHGSMIVTSMGSLGIPAIYHHLYDFGTLPVFISYGNVFTADAIKRDGTRERHHFITIKVVTDERICDGYYYASSFKRLKRYLLHPEVLDNIPESVVEDVD